MIRQNTDRDGFKWTTLLNTSVGTAEGSISSTSKLLWRSARTTVKKKTLPLILARRYRGMAYLFMTWWARREERLCPPYGFFSQ
jgi:hypothetical protein